MTTRVRLYIIYARSVFSPETTITMSVGDVERCGRVMSDRGHSSRSSTPDSDLFHFMFSNHDKFGEVLTHSTSTRPEGKGCLLSNHPYGGCIGIWSPQFWNRRDEYGIAVGRMERGCELLNWRYWNLVVWIKLNLQTCRHTQTASNFDNIQCQKHGMTTQYLRVSNSSPMLTMAKTNVTVP